MSVFTNPAAKGAENAAAYVAAVLELLGDRDPIPIMRETPQRLETLIASVSTGRLHTPEAAGKWSVAEVLAHLANAELVSGYRLRSIMSEKEPRLLGYDQDEWAQRLKYNQCQPQASLGLFRAIRTGNLRLLERVTEQKPGTIDRVFVHVERGEMSLGKLLRLAAGHDLVHQRQIERILRTHGSEEDARTESGGGV